MSERLEVTLTLPLSPSLNNLYFSVGRRRVLSQRGREYHRAVADVVLRDLPSHIRFGKARLKLTVTVYPATRRRFDIDNRVKAVSDSLCKAGMFDDDEQVDELHVMRGDIRPPGSVVVEISVLDGKNGV